jgi:hypothetical protein
MEEHFAKIRKALRQTRTNRKSILIKTESSKNIMLEIQSNQRRAQ